jgi:hypothetical protein
MLGQLVTRCVMIDAAYYVAGRYFSFAASFTVKTLNELSRPVRRSGCVPLPRHHALVLKVGRQAALGELRGANVRPTAQARGRRNDRHAGDGAVRSPGNQYDHRAGRLRVRS